jgi:hypothetical protein
VIASDAYRTLFLCLVFFLQLSGFLIRLPLGFFLLRFNQLLLDRGTAKLAYTPTAR